jgi:hypothetical protein
MKYDVTINIFDLPPSKEECFTVVGKELNQDLMKNDLTFICRKSELEKEGVIEFSARLNEFDGGDSKDIAKLPPEKIGTFGNLFRLFFYKKYLSTFIEYGDGFHLQCEYSRARTYRDFYLLCRTYCPKLIWVFYRYGIRDF